MNKAKTASSFFLHKQSVGDDKPKKRVGDPDMKWYKLVSDTQMFELLYFQGKSASLTITDTVLFDPSRPRSQVSNSVKYWLFNPQKRLKKKYTTILRKNKDSIATSEIFIREFTGMTADELFIQKTTAESIQKVSAQLTPDGDGVLLEVQRDQRRLPRK